MCIHATRNKCLGGSSCGGVGLSGRFALFLAEAFILGEGQCGVCVCAYGGGGSGLAADTLHVYRPQPGGGCATLGAGMGRGRLRIVVH